MVVSEISTARRGIVFGVFQCCATGITDGGLRSSRIAREERIRSKSQNLSRARIKFNSQLGGGKKKKKKNEVDFSYADNVVPSNVEQRFAYLFTFERTGDEEIVAKVPLQRTSSRQTVCIRSKRSPLG